MCSSIIILPRVSADCASGKSRQCEVILPRVSADVEAGSRVSAKSFYLALVRMCKREVASVRNLFEYNSIV